MNNFIIAAFYTINTGYEKEVKNLIGSAHAFYIPIYAEGIKRFGSWQQHTHYKPRFIQKCLKKFKGPVLYLDSDAVIRQYPTLFDEIKTDIGVHYRDDRELLSGTIYFNYNEKVLQLLDEWIKACKEFPNMWEQRILEKLLTSKKWEKELTIDRLPATYCQIFDTMKDAGEPVIEHFQASRRFKNKI